MAAIEQLKIRDYKHMAAPRIPFNRCVDAGNELEYVTDVVRTGRFGTDGTYKKQCETWLREHYNAADAILAQSCTDALEMAAMLADIGPGDEVIMPSFTFSSTANAFALRGATLVFADIDPETLNLDPNEVERAVTDKTKVIVPVDYAGHPCDMAALRQIADNAPQDIMIAEDAAQALMASENGRPVGVHADVATISFHNTKNIACGEGGALIVNNEAYKKRSYILSEKGTNRKAFFLGEIDKYSWVDIGTSAVPSEMTAAYLLGQLEKAEEITNARRKAWDMYWNGFADLEAKGVLKRPYVGQGVHHNAHMFYLLLESNDKRNRLISELRDRGISAPFHYIPLHSAPAGLKLGRATGDMAVTDRVSSTLIRMPMYNGAADDASEVIEAVTEILKD